MTLDGAFASSELQIQMNLWLSRSLHVLHILEPLGCESTHVCSHQDELSITLYGLVSQGQKNVLDSIFPRVFGGGGEWAKGLPGLSLRAGDSFVSQREAE